MTNGFDLGHDLDLWVFKVKCDLDLWNRKDDWHWTKGMGVGHLWPWPWPFGDQGQVPWINPFLLYLSLIVGNLVLTNNCSVWHRTTIFDCFCSYLYIYIYLYIEFIILRYINTLLFIWLSRLKWCLLFFEYPRTPLIHTLLDIQVCFWTLWRAACCDS